VNIFLDSSVLLAACGSANGASRELFRLAELNGWSLIGTPYVVEEVLRNLPLLSQAAGMEWTKLRGAIRLFDDVLTLDRPAVFAAHKDRPILFSALAWADVLLTLDDVHFSELTDRPFYGLHILRPGQFIEQQRAGGDLREA
jgi:predicted nucleic acid-binding protein